MILECILNMVSRFEVSSMVLASLAILTCTTTTSRCIRDSRFTAERSDRSFLVAFQNYKFNCATENSKLLLSVFVTESVVMAGILNTTFVHSTHSAT